MILSRPFSHIVVGLLAICSLFFLTPLSSALGTGLNLTGSTNCTEADFDAYLQFANGPGSYYTIVVNKRNISSHPCVFNGPEYGPSFFPNHVPGALPVTLCYDCGNRLLNGQRPIIPPLTINPGQVARQTFSWKSTSPGEAKICLQPQWMMGPVSLVAPFLLKPICSVVDVSGFDLATPSGSALAQRQKEENTQVHGLRLTSDERTYDLGERFYLHVGLAKGNPQTPSETVGCPTLYLRQRSPDGSTRIDEIRPVAFKGCKQSAMGRRVGDWNSGFELYSGANSRWEGLGQHTMQVFQLLGSRDDPQLTFASSNVLHVEIIDPATIPRKWGPRVMGIAADITLDKETYQLGEDVPLHLAIENFDAKVPIFGPDPVWDPSWNVRIKVRDSAGRLLPPNERFPSWVISSGHGRAPMAYQKGKIVTLERRLGAEGWLPNRTGVYTVIVTWTPWTGYGKGVTGVVLPTPISYATARATATIHIVSGYGKHAE